jgi:hypothetical protein
MAYAAADIFPVDIALKSSGTDSDPHVIRLVSRGDADRAQLSTLLDLDAPAVRLAKMLDADDVREEGAWTLSEPACWESVRRPPQTGALSVAKKSTAASA